MFSWFPINGCRLHRSVAFRVEYVSIASLLLLYHDWRSVRASTTDVNSIIKSGHPPRTQAALFCWPVMQEVHKYDLCCSPCHAEEKLPSFGEVPWLRAQEPHISGSGEATDPEESTLY